MLKPFVGAGAASNIFQVFLQDATKADGSGLTGLVFNSSGLTGYYKRSNGTASVVVTLATITTLGTWVTGGLKEVDATNMPGIYEFHPPDAAFVSGATSVVFVLRGAVNLAPRVIEFQIVAFNPADAVRLGLTALPNANAEAAGGLYTRGSGAGQINQPANGQIDANTVKVGGTTQTGRDLGTSVLLSAGTGTGQLDFTSGVIKANLVQILGTALTETAGQIAAGFKKLFDVAVPVLTAASVNQTGDSYARVGAAGAGLTALGDTRIANLDATISSRTKPADTQAAVTNLTNAPTSGDFTATMKTSLNSATPAVTVSDKTGFSLSAAGIQAIWDALMTVLVTVGSVGKLLKDNLDAAVSSRSIYAGADTSGTTTLLARVPGTVQPQTGDSYARLGIPTGVSVSADLAEIEGETDALVAGVVVTTNNDKTGYALTTGEHTNVAADVQTGLTAQGYTTVRAGYLDTLNGLVTAIWATATRTLTAFGFTVATNSDGNVTDIKAKTDNLPAAPADETLVINATNAIMTRLGVPVTSIAGDIAEVAGETDGIAAIPTANANADALLDRAAGVEAGMTPRQSLRLMLAALAGKLSGAATTTVTIRNVGDTKNRIVATVDANGDRQAVVTDVT